MEKLRGSEAKFQELFETAPVGYHELDDQGRFVRVNRTELAMLGYTASEMLGRPVWDFVGDREIVRETVRAKLAGLLAPNPSFERTYRRKDGTLVPVLVGEQFLRDEQGRVTGIFSTIQDISERKRVEEALRESEERYRLIFDQSPAGIFHYDTQLRITDCNDRFVAILQSSRERLLGFDMNTIKDQSVLPALRKATAGEVGLYEGFYRATTGSAEIWVSLQAAPLLDQRGRVLGGVGIVEDITERERAEGALAAHTRQLEAVRAVTAEITRELDLSTLLDLIVRRAVELAGAGSGVIYLWDEAAQALVAAAWAGLGEWVKTVRFPLGQSLTGTVGQRRQGMIVNDYREWPQADRRFLEHTGLSSALGEPLLYRDVLVGVITLNNQEIGRSFTEQDREILSLLASQAAITIQNARLHMAVLHRSEELHVLLRASRSIMAGLDLQTILDRIVTEAAQISMSPHVKVLLLDRAAQVLRVEATIGPPMPPGTQMLLRASLSGLVATTGEPVFSMDVRNDPRNAFPDRDKELGFVTYLGLPIKVRDEVLGVLTFNTTELRQYSPEELAYLTSLADQAAIAIENARLFAELNQSYRALQHAQDELIRSEKLRALGQMAAGIAHDLNNTLAAILGQVELLQLQVQDAEAQERLGILLTAATDGAQVVRRLQGFARQQLTPTLVVCDLATLVHEAVELTRPHWRDEPQRRGVVNEIRTTLSASGGLPPILGQPAEIREALTNLILNAVDAMPQGGVLTFTGHATAARVTLTVSDTGIGMPEEIRRRIFEPFFTTKGVQGTGLGLPVVYGIMERHGGHIAVTSAPGRGTTVTLRFQAAPALSTSGGSGPEQRHVPPRRLLVIDDDPVVRRTLAALLRTSGHAVTEAEGGAQGLDKLIKDPVDCVLTDLGMPELTGWDVARAVKAHTSQLPVILLTGWGELPAGGAEPAGLVDRILGKPVRLEELLDVIAALTDRPPAPS